MEADIFITIGIKLFSSWLLQSLRAHFLMMDTVSHIRRQRNLLLVPSVTQQEVKCFYEGLSIYFEQKLGNFAGIGRFALH